MKQPWRTRINKSDDSTENWSDTPIYRTNTETKMSSFWCDFHHWLHWKLSFWQLPVQPMMKISSKWQYFHFSEVQQDHDSSAYHTGYTLPCQWKAIYWLRQHLWDEIISNSIGKVNKFTDQCTNIHFNVAKKIEIMKLILIWSNHELITTVYHFDTVHAKKYAYVIYIYSSCFVVFCCG